MQNSECLNSITIFFQNFCEFNSFEEMELDTDSPYLALAHDSLEDCIKRDMREVWNNIRKNDCSNTFAADSSNNFFPRTCCSKHIKHDEREPGFFKEEFRCTEMICLCSKTYCCVDQSRDKIKLCSKGLNKRTLEESCAGSKCAHWTRKQTCNHLTEASERSNIQSARTNKLKKVYHTFILKELYSMMAFTRNNFFCKWNDSIIILQFLIF